MATDAQFYFAGISASADGTLAVRPPPAVVFPDSNALNAELRLVDRSGTDRVATARLFSYVMALSPIDSRTWPPRSKTYAPARRTCRWWTSQRPHRAADDDARVYREPGLVRRRQALAYAYQPPGQIDDVYIKDLDTGAIQPVIETPKQGEHPVAWSHDGRSLLVFTYDDDKASLSSWSFASRTLTPFIGPGAVGKRGVLAPG